MGLKHPTAWSCCQLFIGWLLARTTAQRSIRKRRSLPFTVGANTRNKALGQITFVRRGNASKTRIGFDDAVSIRAWHRCSPRRRYIQPVNANILLRDPSCVGLQRAFAGTRSRHVTSDLSRPLLSAPAANTKPLRSVPFQ